MKNIIKNIPMTALGQIIGSIIVIPIIVFLINNLYYAHRYNDDAENIIKTISLVRTIYRLQCLLQTQNITLKMWIKIMKH